MKKHQNPKNATHSFCTDKDSSNQKNVKELTHKEREKAGS